MTRPTQDQEEKLTIERFIEVSGLRWTALEKGWNRPGEPDFYCQASEGRVGVELCQVFLDSDRALNGASSLKESEERAQGSLKELADAYYSLCSIPIRAMFYSSLPTRDQIPAVAKLLSDAAIEAPVMRSLEFEFLSNIDGYLYRLPADFADYRVWSFVPTSVGWNREVGIDFIEAATRKKATKLGAYQKYVDQVILLLHASGSTKSGFIRLADELVLTDGHGFKQIFLFVSPDKWNRLYSRVP